LTIHRKLTAPLVAGLVVAGLVACGGDDDDDDAGNPPPEDGSAAVTSPDSPEADAVVYTVSELEYTDVTASAGGFLEIANESGEDHTFTADDGSFDFEYGANEHAFVDVPQEAGTYPFHCEIHPDMKATLTAE